MDAKIDIKVQSIKAEYDSTIKEKEAAIKSLKTESKQKRTKTKKR